MMVAANLPGAVEVREKFAEVLAFQQLVHQHLVKDHDYGTIPGTQKPTLLKPGAEKLVKLLDLADCYVTESSVEDWDRPLFSYTIKCQLKRVDGGIVAEGLGQCSTMEDRYRWRWVFDRDIPRDVAKDSLKTRTIRGGGIQYRIPNDDIYTQINTVLKMAKKRALVDAALSVGRLSDLFTQDMEDLRPAAPDDAIEGTFRESPAAEPTPSSEPSNDDVAPPLCHCGKAMKYLSGTSKTGNPYKGWACQVPTENDPKKMMCPTRWIND